MLGHSTSRMTERYARAPRRLRPSALGATSSSHAATLRQEALDHFIFLNPDHVRRVVSEYVRCYNRARPSQAIYGIPDPFPELREPAPATGRLLALPVLGGLIHDYRLAA